MQSELKKNKQKKSDSGLLTFLKTFIISFLVVILIATPLFAKVNEVLDLTPGRDDIPILEEVIDFKTLIPTDSPFFDAFINANKVNVLLLGYNEFEGLTDTIVLACIDLDNKFIDIISIPRDTYYYRGPGYLDDAHHKINAVYRKDAVNSAIAVSRILMNIPINYYAVLNYEGTAAIVDSMKGVPMDIPFHMRYDDPNDRPPLHIDIKPGPQVLDGKTSVEFLRFRRGNPGYRGYPDADLGRIKAQHEFMKSALKQCLSFDLPDIAKTAFENVDSDMNLRTMLYLATKGIGMSSDNIRTYTMPYNKMDFFIHSDKQGIIDMLTEIYSLDIEDEGDASSL
jgi:LCP family protein required for cell wall assembly